LGHAPAASHTTRGFFILNAVIKLVEESLLHARHLRAARIVPRRLLGKSGKHTGIPGADPTPRSGGSLVDEGETTADGTDEGADPTPQAGVSQVFPVGIVVMCLDGLREVFEIDRLSRLKRGSFFKGYNFSNSPFVSGLKIVEIGIQELVPSLRENPEEVTLLKRNDLDIHPRRVERTSAHAVTETGGSGREARYPNDTEALPALLIAGVRN